MTAKRKAIMVRKVSAFDQLVRDLDRADAKDKHMAKAMAASNDQVVEMGRKAMLNGRLSSIDLTRLERLVERGVELSPRLLSALQSAAK